MNSYEFTGEKSKRRERKASGSAGVALLRRLAEAQRPRSSFLRFQASVGLRFGPCPGVQALLEGSEPSTWTQRSLKLGRLGHIPIPSAGPTRRFGLIPSVSSRALLPSTGLQSGGAGSVDYEEAASKVLGLHTYRAAAGGHNKPRCERSNGPIGRSCLPGVRGG